MMDFLTRSCAAIGQSVGVSVTIRMLVLTQSIHPMAVDAAPFCAVPEHGNESHKS